MKYLVSRRNITNKSVIYSLPIPEVSYFIAVDDLTCPGSDNSLMGELEHRSLLPLSSVSMLSFFYSTDYLFLYIFPLFYFYFFMFYYGDIEMKCHCNAFHYEIHAILL